MDAKQQQTQKYTQNFSAQFLSSSVADIVEDRRQNGKKFVLSWRSSGVGGDMISKESSSEINVDGKSLLDVDDDANDDEADNRLQIPPKSPLLGLEFTCGAILR
jgi:hypothetical protein